MDTAPRLNPIMEVVNRLTVALLAQPMDAVEPGESPAAVCDRAAAGGYDWMPLRGTDGEIVRLVPVSDILRFRKSPRFPDPRDIGRPATVAVIISLDSPIHQLVRRLADEPILCCLGPDGLRHVVTNWDLARPAAQEFAFALALVVEEEIAHCLASTVSVDQYRTIVNGLGEDAPVRDRGEAWFQRRERKEGLGFIDELSFGAKLRLLDSSPDSKATLKERARAGGGVRLRQRQLLGDVAQVKTMRNRLGHPGQQTPQKLRERMALAYDLSHVLAAGRLRLQEGTGSASEPPSGQAEEDPMPRLDSDLLEVVGPL